MYSLRKGGRTKDRMAKTVPLQYKLSSIRRRRNEDQVNFNPPREKSAEKKGRKLHHLTSRLRKMGKRDKKGSLNIKKSSMPVGGKGSTVVFGKELERP